MKQYERDMHPYRIVHWGTLAYCMLLILWSFLMCFSSYSCALDDFHKFQAFGSPLPFEYYLQGNDFGENVFLFLCLIIEFILYCVQYHWGKMRKRVAGSIWYFSVMLLLHIILLVYTSSLGLPFALPYDSADFPAVYWRRIARTTMFPSVLYFISYRLCIRDD